MDFTKEKIKNLVMESYEKHISINYNLVNEINKLMNVSLFRYDDENNEIVIKTHHAKTIQHSKITYNDIGSTEHKIVYIPVCLINLFGIDYIFNKYTGSNYYHINAISEDTYFYNGEPWHTYYDLFLGKA